MIWKEPGSAFKYFAPVPVPPKLTPSISKQSQQRAHSELLEDETVRDIMGMGRPAKGKAKANKASERGESSGGSSSGSSSSSSSSTGAKAANALDQLKEGWVPFGASPPFLSKTPKFLVTKRKMDESFGDSLSAVSPDALPNKLGRSDVYTKRVHEADPTPAVFKVGDPGITEAVAARMRRSQAYAKRKDRPEIVLDCVEAFRNASR